MSPNEIQSYRSLLEGVEECPGVIAILTDSSLETLSRHLPLDPGLRSGLLGEALVRLWLYGERCPAGLREILEEHFGGAFLDSVGSRDPSMEGEGNFETVPGFAHLRERIFCFRSADGIIPLVSRTWNDEAVALPFLLNLTDRMRPQIRDRSGKPVPGWRDSFAVLGEDFTAGSDVVLLSEFGHYISRLEGRSFGLPLVLARERKRGRAVIEDIDPLDLIASGQLSLGRLEEVDGVAAKSSLAKRLGASFVVVARNRGEEKDVLFLSSNSAIPEALERISDFIEEKAISRLGPDSALARIRCLEEKILLGAEEVELALPRLERYEKILEDGNAKAPRFEDGRLKVRLLRASLLNHTGDAESANAIIEELEASDAYSEDPVDFVEAMAARVVALTDMGHLDAAERIGRDLMAWIDAGKFKGSREAKVRCLMKAHGTLGGQPLLQKALHEPSVADESFHHLEKALEYAEDLDDEREIAFDLVQLVLWRALLDPGAAESAHQEAEERLSRMTVEKVHASRQYLAAHRLLAAYRSSILGIPVSPGATEWDLPEKGSSASDWLLGMSLKYRAVVRTYLGDHEGAGEDFREGLKQMGFPLSPLLRFISGTIAAEAHLALSQHGEDRFRKEALNRLEGLPVEFSARFRVSEWMDLVKEHTGDPLPERGTNLRLGSRY